MPEPAIQNQTHPAPKELAVEIRRRIGVLRQGWRLIAISAAVCLMIAGLYVAVAKRVYQATTRLLVLQQGGRPLNVANSDPNRIMEGTDDYIPTHSMIVCSPMVVKQAIEKVGLEHLPTLLAAKKADKDPVEVAILNIKVTRPDRMAKIFRVDYQAGDREETDRLVEALVASYQQFLGDTYQKNSGTVITLISKARDDLSRELKKLEDQYLEFRRTNSNVIVGQEGRSFWASRLTRWDQAANDAMVKVVQLKTQLEVGRKLAGDGAELWTIAHAITQVGGDSNSLMALVTAGSSQNGEADLIRQLAIEQQQLVERHGPDYAKVKELKLQIDRIRERGRSARSHLEAGELKDMLASIERSLESVQTMREDLRAQFDQAEQKAKQVEVDMLTEENLRSKLERQRALFSSVVDQLKQAQFVGDFTSVTSQVIEPPHTLRHPVWPKPTLTLALSLVTGCMLGVGAVFFRDRLDQRVRSLAELRQAMGLAVLGEIGQVPADQASLVGAIGLISHSKPRSHWAEAYRAVRTNIDFLRRNKRIQVIVVTSPYHEDGKSTSASNLAISDAHAGRRVLLIDGDLHRPIVHQLFDLDPERGFSHLLRDLIPKEQAVQHTMIANLDVITAGEEVDSPAELLSSPRLEKLLDEFRQSYDVIIIDSPPVLDVTDPAILGAVADGMVVVVHASTLRYHDAARIRELLHNLGTPVLGMVVNGIGHADSGYGYGYGYGYGLGFGHYRYQGAQKENGEESYSLSPLATTQQRGRRSYDSSLPPSATSPEEATTQQRGRRSTDSSLPPAATSPDEATTPRRGRRSYDK